MTSRVEASAREHARKIRARAVTVSFKRTTTTRDRGNLQRTDADVGPVTIGVYIARNVQSSTGAPGPPAQVEKALSMGALLPIFLDDGVTPLYPNAAAMPNDPNTVEQFVDPNFGTLTIEHVLPVRVETVLIGYQADLAEVK